VLAFGKNRLLNNIEYLIYTRLIFIGVYEQLNSQHIFIGVYEHLNSQYIFIGVYEHLNSQHIFIGVYEHLNSQYIFPAQNTHEELIKLIKIINSVSVTSVGLMTQSERFLRGTYN
jgi:translation initiation factor 6 (eIF-6)